MSTPRRAGAIVVTAGACLTLIGTFLTWVESGAADRTSYEVFGLVDRLGISPDGVVGWALRLWPLVPVLLVLGVAAVWWAAAMPRWTVIAAVLIVICSIYAGVTALAVARAPEMGELFGAGPGPWVTLVGSLVMLVGIVLGWVWHARVGGRRH